jgi:hypothetical protein
MRTAQSDVDRVRLDPPIPANTYNDSFGNSM